MAVTVEITILLTTASNILTITVGPTLTASPIQNPNSNATPTSSKTPSSTTSSTSAGNTFSSTTLVTSTTSSTFPSSPTIIEPSTSPGPPLASITPQKSQKLSDAQTEGLAFGICLGVGLLALLGWFWWWRRKTRAAEAEEAIMMVVRNDRHEMELEDQGIPETPIPPAVAPTGGRRGERRRSKGSVRSVVKRNGLGLKEVLVIVDEFGNERIVERGDRTPSPPPRSPARLGSVIPERGHRNRESMNSGRRTASQMGKESEG